MVEVVRVKSRKDKKNFINFENKLYNECEYFVPRIYKDEIKLFSSKKNPNLMSNETTGYLAYQNGKLAGRILCSFNRIEKEKRNIVRFSHFDFINDSEVSFALLDVVDKWSKFLKTDKIIGDMYFNDLGNIGVLNSGFEKLSSFQNRYNYPYYVTHLKEYGYIANKKLKEYQLELNNFDLYDINSLLGDNLKLVEGNKEFKIKNYARKIFDLLYTNSISGYPIVIEEKVYEQFFKSLNKLFGDEDLVIIVNENDDVVGAMLVTNNTSIALQTTEGKEFSSKNMYNVDVDNHKFVDLSLYVTSKDDSELINNILSRVLVNSMLNKNNKYINTNHWIQNFSETQFASLFNINWQRERLIFSKSFKLINIKKDKTDIIDIHNIANSSLLQ